MTKTNDKKWMLLGLTLLMQGFVIGLIIYSFTFFIVPWREEFAVQQSMLMLAMTGFAVVNDGTASADITVSLELDEADSEGAYQLN